MTTKDQREQLLRDIEAAQFDAASAYAHKKKFIALLQAAIADRVREGDLFEGDEGPFIVRHISFCDKNPEAWAALGKIAHFRLHGTCVRRDGTGGTKIREGYVDIHGDKLVRENIA